MSVCTPECTKIANQNRVKWERKEHHMMQFSAAKFSPKSSSSEEHSVTWGTCAKQESPTSRDVYFSLCCFCTRDF